MSAPAPWLCRLLLLRPETVAARLAEAERAGLCAKAPNLWQITLGILRMWHRVLFRSDTIGLSRSRPPRASPRARWLRHRPLRFPFLLAERAVTPWDFSGLLSSRERVLCHLLGAHHDGQEFAYDLQLLRCHPGAAQELRERALAVVRGSSAKAAWLRDLVVYEGYHEELLAAVERELDGHELGAALDDPDVTLSGYLAWCAAQPPTPEATLRAWRAGSFSVAHGLVAHGLGAPAEVLA
jgi:hypothetical protein